MSNDLGGVRFLIINGFDRSGTSMIAKVLAKHPQIEAIFQPFNATILRTTQWDYWEPNHMCYGVEKFMGHMLNGYIDKNFIASDWFKKHSTTQKIVPGKLHVIKTTNLHFKIDWFLNKFPQVEIFSIERSFFATVCSLMRNNFYQEWYGEDAYQAICEYVKKDDKISANLRACVYDAKDDLEKMGVIIAVRTSVMRRSTKKTIYYERIMENPNSSFNEVTGYFGLDSFDFEPYMQEDYNIIGKNFELVDLWKTYFNKYEISKLERIFSNMESPILVK
ncbi:sulfotransferase [Ammoniphilus sp. 3BR4]|uniref:sulfotransferase n=1 Tax=Ammoniphilus sp. 3BR4 TaxID=3158265 RepID=UPI003465919E